MRRYVPSFFPIWWEIKYYPPSWKNVPSPYIFCEKLTSSKDGPVGGVGEAGDELCGWAAGRGAAQDKVVPAVQVPDPHRQLTRRDRQLTRPRPRDRAVSTPAIGTYTVKKRLAMCARPHAAGMSLTNSPWRGII